MFLAGKGQHPIITCCAVTVGMSSLLICEVFLCAGMHLSFYLFNLFRFLGQSVCAAGAWFTPYLAEEHPELSLNFQVMSEHSSVQHSAPLQHSSSSLKTSILGCRTRTDPKCQFFRKNWEKHCSFDSISHGVLDEHRL